MGKGGAKTVETQNQNQSQQNMIDPEIRQAAMNNYAIATQTADQYQPVFRQAPVGFNADQQQSQQMGRDFVGNNVGGATLQSGLDAANRAASYAPSQVGAYGYTPTTISSQLQGLLGGTPAGYTAAQSQFQYSPQQVATPGNVSAGSVSAQDVSARNVDAARMNRGDVRDVSTQMTPDVLKSYLASFDPTYAQGVIDPALADLERNRQMVQNKNAGAASAAGAFGGSRHGIVDAETNRGYADVAAQTSGDLRYRGFESALGALQSDLGRRAQTDLSNQGMDYGVAGQNAGFQQGANLANADNSLRAGMANQGAQLQAGMSNQNAGLQAGIANQNAGLQAGIANQNAGLSAAQMGLQNSLANAGFSNDALRFGATAQNDRTGMQLQGLLADQGAQNQAGQFYAGQQQNAGIANQGAGLQANGQSLQAAGLLAGMSDQQRQQYLQNVGVLGGVGDVNQQYQQSLQDTQYANDLARQQAPLDQLSIRQSGLAMTPYNTSTSGTSSGTTTRQTFQPWWQTAMNVVGMGSQLMGLSDKRLKKNVRKISGPLDAIHKLKGVTYDWIDDGRPDVGLLAQDMQRAVPGSTQMIDGKLHYNPLAAIGLLTASVQELDKRTRRK